MIRVLHAPRSHRWHGRSIDAGGLRGARPRRHTGAAVARKLSGVGAAVLGVRIARGEFGGRDVARGLCGPRVAVDEARLWDDLRRAGGHVVGVLLADWELGAAAGWGPDLALVGLEVVFHREGSLVSRRVGRSSVF